MSGQEKVPRNYFVIAPAKTRRDTPPVWHDRLPAVGGERLTGALRLLIETLTPVHAGTGAYGREGRRLVKEPMRRNGVLVIPGSSIKGCVRQAYEALTDSGSPFEDDTALHGDGPLSSAASLFGALGYQGRVSFDDALPEDPMEAVLVELSVPYPPAKEAGRRFYGDMAPGAKQDKCIPAWAIPVGARLITHVRLRNVTDAEIGGVLLSLGVGRFCPRLGGGRYDAYGSVRFSVTARRLRSDKAFGRSEWDERGPELRAFCERCVAAFEPTAEGAKALEQFERRLTPVNAVSGGQAP